LYQTINGLDVFVAGTQQNSPDFSYTVPLANGCYELRHCALVNDQAGNPFQVMCQWNFCVKLAAQENDCCRLDVYALFHPATGTWRWGDGTTSLTHPGPWHQYHNVNTYDVNPINITRAGNSFTYPIQVLNGIWAGEDCSTVSLNNQVNRLNTALKLFPSALSTGQRIAIEGTLEADYSYTFRNDDLCMWPGARMLVSTNQPITVDATLLHDKVCTQNGNSSGSWYAIELNRFGGGTNFNVINQSRITGAYAGIYSNSTFANTVNISNTNFDRCYIGIRVRTRTTFASFANNTFGLGQSIAKWPMFSSLCGWENLIPKQLNAMPFAGIYVEPFGTNNVPLNLTAATGVNQFFNLANGIYSQNSSVTVRNCRMLDMHCGIYPTTGGGWDDGYGIFMESGSGRALDQIGFGQAGLSTFERCRHGVYAGASGGQDITLRVSENRMVGMHYGVTAILKANTGFVQGGNHFVSFNSIDYGTDVCLESNLMHGVLLNYTDLTTAPLRIADNIINTTRLDYGVGIDLQGSGNTNAGLARAKVERNQVNNGVFGIRAYQFSEAHIDDNDITNFSQSGIQVNSSGRNITTNNTTNSAPGSYKSGLDLFMSPSNTMACNTMQASLIGMEVRSASGGASINCNTFDNLDNIGLFYHQSPVTGDQITGGIDSKNTWLGNYSSPKFHASLIGNATAAGVVYDADLASMNVNPLMGWFNAPTSQQQIVCACDSLDGFKKSTQLTDFERSIVDGLSIPTALEAFQIEMDLMTKLWEYPDLRNQSVAAQSYFNKHSGSNASKLAQVALGISQTSRLDQQLAYQQAETRKNEIEAILSSLDQVLVSANDLEAQLSQRFALAGELEALDNQIIAIRSALYAQNTSTADNLRVILGDVNPVESWEASTKALLSISLDTWMIGESENETQTEILRSIAQACQSETGSSVAHANTWLRNLHNEEYSNICAQNRSENIQIAEQRAGSMNISPNPASNQFTIDFGGVSMKSVEVLNAG
jgi:hypothetical protein